MAALRLVTRVFLAGNHIDRRRFFKGILCSIKASLAKQFVFILKA